MIMLSTPVKTAVLQRLILPNIVKSQYFSRGNNGMDRRKTLTASRTKSLIQYAGRSFLLNIRRE